MLDEAFMPFSEMVEKMVSIDGEVGEVYDEVEIIHSYIYAFEVGTPVELDVIRDENGKLMIGTIPPMYRVSTSYRPSYHTITFKAEKIVPYHGE